MLVGSSQRLQLPYMMKVVSENSVSETSLVLLTPHCMGKQIVQNQGLFVVHNL